MNYKITDVDLIGELEDFPIEVVGKMLEYQVKQNAPDVTIFQRNAAADVSQGGFRWSDTKEGAQFWCEIIHNKRFSRFFATYPKWSHFVYIVQDGTKDGKDIIATLEKYGGVNNFAMKAHWSDCIYYIDPIDKNIMALDIEDECKSFLKTFYTEIDVEPSVKEYTMQEIADKLGVDVELLRIKK